MPTFEKEELKLTTEEQLAFDQLPEGKEAAVESGTPFSFCETLSSSGKKYQTITVLRGGERLETAEGRAESLPKPTWVAAKSTDWDFIKGQIASRDVIGFLGKRSFDEESKKYNGVVKTDKPDIPDDQYPPPLVESIPYVISKDELAQRGHTIISESETEILMTANDDPRPDGQKIIFKVDLANPTAEGNYPLYCKSPLEDVFHRVEILGMANKEGELIPIGRDQDACFFGVHRSQIMQEAKSSPLPAMAHETLNTFTPGGRVSMINSIESLTGTSTRPDEVVHLGCASAHEGTFMAHVDREHRQKQNIRTNNFQHGAENHSPKEKRSNLNGKMLHIYFDEHNVSKIKMTQTEKQLAFMAQSYADRYYFEVHPKWNMQLWAPVIEKQLISGFSVHAETMVNYLAYKNKEAIPTDPEEYKIFVKNKLSEEVTLGDHKFTPLDRIHVQPIQNMAIWGPVIQAQLDRLAILGEEKSNIKENLRPHALLAYYQEKFAVVDKFVNVAARKTPDAKESIKKSLQENFVIFEKSIVDAVLKDEKAVVNIIIHPEFDLEKWLPVFIKKLELANGDIRAIDSQTLDAFCKLYTNQTYKPLKSDDPLLLTKLKELQTGLEGKKIFADLKEKRVFEQVSTRSETMMHEKKLSVSSNVVPKVTKRHSTSDKSRPTPAFREEQERVLRQRAKPWGRSSSVAIKPTSTPDAEKNNVVERKLKR